MCALRRVPRWMWPALAALAAYLNALGGSFQFDDWNTIVNRENVHGVARFLSVAASGARPLLNLSFALNWRISPAPVGFILVNLLLHAANSALVFLVSKTVLGHVDSRDEGRQEATSLAISLLFALHPVQTESVTYISGRSESLMAFFYLGSFLLYVNSAGSENRRPAHLLSPVLFLFSLAVRETAVTLPAALLLFEAARGPRDGWKKALTRIAPFGALLLIGLLLIAANRRYSYLLVYSQDLHSGASTVVTNIYAIGYLLSRLVMIGDLNIDPDLRRLDSFSPLTISLGLLFSASAVWAIAVRKRRPLVFLGVGWFFLHLMPTNSVIPRLDVASEHHLYLPLFGMLIATVPPAASLPLERFATSVRSAGFFVLLLALFLFTVGRNRDYATEITLWEKTAANSPGKARPHNNLGYAYYLAGRGAEAEREYRSALECDPAFYKARNNLFRLNAERAEK